MEFLQIRRIVLHNAKPVFLDKEGAVTYITHVLYTRIPLAFVFNEFNILTECFNYAAKAKKKYKEFGVQDFRY